MSKSIKFNKTFNHPVEKIWKALTDKDAMSKWLMPCNMEPFVGNQFQFTTKPGPGFSGIVECEVLEIQENCLLSFSWCHKNMNTIVTFKLSAQGDQTYLDFEHSGFEGVLENLFVKKILANGWKKKILNIQLPNYLSA